MTELFAEPTICCADFLAAWFAIDHAERLRHVAAGSRWMIWDGRRWREDDTLMVLDLARDQCRTLAKLVRELRLPKGMAARLTRRLGDPGFVARVERMARTDRRFAATADRFDADPDLLNTPAGIVDTRSGVLTPHRPEAYMTRITEADAAAPGTPCPGWFTLLDRMTGGDAELHFFVQRVAGRALARRSAGGKPEAAASGDHPFLDTLSRILGDDSAVLAIREGLDLVRLDPVSPDPDLADRLAGEYPAILRWAIDGAMAWRRIGLAPPTHARQPTAGEAIARFLADHTASSPTAWVSAGDLYARWEEQMAKSGASAGSQKAFCQAIAARGYAPSRRHGGRRGFTGLALRTRADEAAEVASPSVTATRGEAAQRSEAEEGHTCDPAPAMRAGRRDDERGDVADSRRSNAHGYACVDAGAMHPAPSVTGSGFASGEEPGFVPAASAGLGDPRATGFAARSAAICAVDAATAQRGGNSLAFSAFASTFPLPSLAVTVKR